MGLFSDIYNTVAKFFRPQEGAEGEASKSVAANRLKLVLMQDRTNLTPKILEQMRGELIDLLSRYVELDKELLELNFEQEGDQVALMLSIPVIRAKDEDEIEAAIKASKAIEEEQNQDEESKESADDIIDENNEGEIEDSEEETSENTEESADKENTTEIDGSESEISKEDMQISKEEAVQEIVSSTGRIIKKKKVSAPEGMSPQKDSNSVNCEDKAECSSEQ